MVQDELAPLAGNTKVSDRNAPTSVHTMSLHEESDDDNASIATQDTDRTVRESWRQRANRARNSFTAGLSRNSSTDSRQSIQDRVLNKVMTQIIPNMPLEEEDEGQDLPDSLSDRTIKKNKPSTGRPDFNLGTMAVNFRLFNSRIGVVFVFQDMMVDLFSWKHPTHTLSFLAVHTLICLQPHLIPVVPLAILLFAIMIPNFIARHAAPANDPRIGPRFTGPPTAPAVRIKPAPEVSRDFLRNMRDLQNTMGDFSVGHDAITDNLTPLVNFGDEKLSSTLFLTITIISCALLLGTWIVPYQAVALIGGWALIALAHPEVQKFVLTVENLQQLQEHAEALYAVFRTWVDADILLDEPAESRQVEIFELQKHHASSDTWESWLFSATPFDPLSPERNAGNRPKGTQFFEEVLPPTGWSWTEKKWSLDLFSREWVEQRMIAEVEVETEGERWVYDLPGEETPFLDTMTVGPSSNTRSNSRTQSLPNAGWEETTGLGKHGEWRRRRWTRLVERRKGDKKFIETEISRPISVP